MKWLRMLSLLAIISLLPNVLFAQTSRTFGVKGGYILSNFWGNGTDKLNNSLREVFPNLDEKNLPWFAVSMFWAHDLLPELAALQSEIVYYRGGKAYKGTLGGSTRHFQMQVDYIAMPVTFKVKLPLPLKPSIYIGPQISWMFRSRADNMPAAVDTTPFFRGTGTDASNGIFNRNTNVVDLGFITGMDFGIPFGPGNIVLDGRFQLGCVDVYNYSGGTSVRNYNFMFMAGYAFDFGSTY